MRAFMITAWVTACTATAGAGVVTFETKPDGTTPADNEVLPVTDFYSIDGVKVRFGFDTTGDGLPNSPAEFEQVTLVSDGGSQFGFVNTDLGNDQPDTGETTLGDFFLRQSSFGTTFSPFIIDYDPLGNTITAASGEIWDIDGTSATNTEQYRVEAFDASNNSLGVVISPLGDSDGASSLDGKPWAFGFNNLSAGIDRIVITFTGGKTSGIGLAFNNFSPTVDQSVIPLPSAPLLAFPLLAALALKRPRRVGTTHGTSE